MPPLNIQTHLKGAGCSMQEDPARRERWGFLTEDLDSYCHGVTRTDRDALAEKRIVVENLLDSSLRRVQQQGEGSDSILLDKSAIEPLYEALFAEDELDEATVGSTTMGWATPGTIPSTDKIFTTQSLGMVRRVFPRMIATDLISVQPIAQPTGKVFFLDIKYDADAAGSVSSGDRVDDTTAWDFSGQRDYASYTDTTGVNTSSAIVEGAAAREVVLDISAIDVTSETKKLASEWSVEVQQDLRAYHGLSADGELTAATAAEITREIDRTLINFIATTAETSGAGTVFWNKSGYSGVLPSETKAWDETLFDAFEDCQALIEGKRYRRATWLLGNHNTCARIRKLNGFRSMMAGQNGMDLQLTTGGRRFLGTLQNTFYIYCDPWFDDDVIIMGYKGSSFFEAGIVYSPYIPFFRTPLFVDPGTFMNKRGIMSRFAKTAVVSEMYARVVMTTS